MPALALWLLLVLAGATTLGLGARTEDEARRLLVTQSIVRDGDIDLRDDFGARAWRSFYDGELVPAGDGRLEPQSLGFPALAAPAYALGGPLAVEGLLLLVWAAGWVAARGLARTAVPDPWATRATLALALSPGALGASTRIGPDAAAGALLAGGALLALRTRAMPRTRTAGTAAALAALAPWLTAKAAGAALVLAVAAVRWPRRRRRGLAALLAAEVAVLSAVVYVAVNDALFGGPTPAAASRDPATGATGLAAHLARAPRLAQALADAVAAAPVLLLAAAGGAVAWRWRRDRLAPLVAEEAVTLGLTLAAAGAVWLVAAFLVPGRPSLAAALVLLAPVVALGLRRTGRGGAAIAVVSVALGAGHVVAGRL